MSSPSRVLAPIVTGAVHAAFGDGFRDEDPVLRPSQFADVQANAALALAKRVGLAPREVAARVAENLDLVGVCSSAEVSGPGFINFMLDDAWIADQASEMAAEGRLGVPQLPAECIPVDYSAPNVAKEMHVGHLRTTVVGDALVRVLEHLGHRVVRQNHIGDWGTPFRPRHGHRRQTAPRDVLRRVRRQPRSTSGLSRPCTRWSRTLGTTRSPRTSVSLSRHCTALACG